MVVRNRAVAAQEIEKYALYLDAAETDPKPLDLALMDRLGAAFAEGDFSGLVAAVAGGDPPRTGERTCAPAGGQQGERRADTRVAAAVHGSWCRWDGRRRRARSAEDVVRSAGRACFLEGTRPAMADQLSRWRVRDAERALSRLLAAEGEVKSSGGADGDLLAANLFLGLARHARHTRGRRFISGLDTPDYALAA